MEVLVTDGVSGAGVKADMTLTTSTRVEQMYKKERRVDKVAFTTVMLALANKGSVFQSVEELTVKTIKFRPPYS